MSSVIPFGSYLNRVPISNVRPAFEKSLPILKEQANEQRKSSLVLQASLNDLMKSWEKSAELRKENFNKTLEKL